MLALALIWLLFWFLVQVQLLPSPVIQFRCVRVSFVFSLPNLHMCIFALPLSLFWSFTIGNITMLYVICVYYHNVPFWQKFCIFCLHHSYISLEILFSDYTNFCYAKHIIVVFSVGSPSLRGVRVCSGFPIWAFNFIIMFTWLVIDTNIGVSLVVLSPFLFALLSALLRAISTRRLLRGARLLPGSCACVDDECCNIWRLFSSKKVAAKS